MSKLKNRKAVILIILLATISFPSISQTTEDLSISFVKQLERQQFDSCYRMFDTVMASKFSASMLEGMWQSIPKYMGDYKSYSTVSSEKKDTLDLVYVRCEFEKTKMDLQFAFNKSKKIVGMYFVPPKSKAAYAYPEYSLPHKFYETKITLKSGIYNLPGILCVPNNIKNPPVAILLAGSGPNDKDETIGANKALKDIALGLASNGIASYRYDKRTLAYGKVMSEKLEEFDLYDEVIEDAISAIKMITKLPDFKASKVHIIGHSLGAMCAPLIASKSKKVSGIVLLAGNARPLEDVVLDQYHYIFGLDSLDDSEEKEILEFRKKMQIVKNPKLLKIAQTQDLPLNGTAKYWQSLVKYNQVQVAKKLRQPILVLQGERDYQVTMIDYNLWKQNLGDKAKNKFISYPALNHLLMKGEGKSTAQEYEVQGNVDEKIILDITAWIKGK